MKQAWDRSTLCSIIKKSPGQDVELEMLYWELLGNTRFIASSITHGESDVIAGRPSDKSDSRVDESGQESREDLRPFPLTVRI
jgi:hypothetical protein